MKLISEKQLLDYLPFTILLISFSSISNYLEDKTGFPFGNTTIWWLLNSFTIFLFFQGKYFYFKNDDNPGFVFIKLYLLWNGFCVFRGMFVAENYWDLKNLTSNCMSLLVPITSYVVTNKMILQKILSFYVKYALPLFLIIAFVIVKPAYGFYLVPVGFIIFFIPVLTFKWKLLVLFFAFIVMITGVSNRSNIIKFGVPVILLAMYYLRYILPIYLTEIFRKFLFIAPFIFLFLGIYGSFNIFKIDEYISGNYVESTNNSNGEIVEEDLTIDTRTFIYEEVLQTALKYDSWWIGRTPAFGNETEAFVEEDLTGRGERIYNEVGILNVFTWTGSVGVMLFMFIFYRASYLAVNHSNNIFSKMLGVFVAFRWVYAWVEDINIFTLTYVFIWVMVGFCMSSSFRCMSDSEMKLWVRGIFSKQYRKIEFKRLIKS